MHNFRFRLLEIFRIKRISREPFLILQSKSNKNWKWNSHKLMQYSCMHFLLTRCYKIWNLESSRLFIETNNFMQITYWRCRCSISSFNYLRWKFTLRLRYWYMIIISILVLKQWSFYRKITNYRLNIFRYIIYLQVRWLMWMCTCR